ncbi:CPBP family intramembrane glutamic endopeptidase [Bacillus sp. FJAT-49736]|uniref:CPBP family intramembrane glutamic endopeptidase n=1 Tax=Bacillus sp. FJAT-49736 TaxID=2833582 RepID=UPI001BC93832|nr:CPBP family intramembrane glutamic endopeptidase [Bacillus sp. FJAT-49736]MBS4174954.1 CPBP family intramembrane metalloprotease [Bacillus sp. FJAT-49736]
MGATKMKEDNIRLNSSWLSPNVKKKVNHLQFNTYMIGLLLVYTLEDFFSPSIQWIFSIYTIVAWVTIFTIDPSRLPEAVTSKIKQRKAKKYFILFALPLFLIILILMFILKVPLILPPFTFGYLLNVIIQACLLEVLYRNILQPRFRQLGYSSTVSICFQSILFAIMLYVHTSSIIITAGSFLIGIITGLIAYLTRSIRLNIVIMIIWILLFFNP